ncbi:unnamed protein product [Pleuronectes platessa]|uniref:Uncharacterized protein n=1 Tax=Pleuronectes platessa TaxID=8262 RepID=A0A9N7UBV7_PLEPL|nr:unnamed protein product [Pleuronectes platessa]
MALRSLTPDLCQTREPIGPKVKRLLQHKAAALQFLPRSRSAASMFNILHLAALSVLAGTAATLDFTGSAQLDITSCPITYYGQKYSKIYVGFSSSTVSVCFNRPYLTWNEERLLPDVWRSS